MTSTLPGDWHVVAAPLATQVFWSGVGAAAAVGAATVATTAAHAANRGAMWLSLTCMVAFLLSPELLWCVASPESGPRSAESSALTTIIANGQLTSAYLSATNSAPADVNHPLWAASGETAEACPHEHPALGT